jgi:hypothetical protein
MEHSASFKLLVFTLVSITLSPVMAEDELVYVPVSPCRIVDTRIAGDAITANTYLNFRVSGTLGELASQGGQTDCLDPKAGTGQKPLAISAYVVAVPANGSSTGVLTAYPSHLPPPPVGAGSTVNFAPGQVIGNTTNITLCDQATCPTDGEFAILARNTNQHVVIDVQGYFYPSAVQQFVAQDANGDTIGVMWGGEIDHLSVRTPQGFVSEVLVTNGRLIARADAYFTDTDCGSSGGTAYLDFGVGPTDEGAVLVPGSVFDIVHAYGFTPLPPELWYFPKPALLLDNQSVQSVRKWDWSVENGSVVCAPVSATLSTAARIFPNDPAVTGFPNSAFPAPITIEYQ